MIDLDQVALDAARQLTPANDVQARATMQCAIIAALRRALPAKPEAVRLRDERRERSDFEAWARPRFRVPEDFDRIDGRPGGWEYNGPVGQEPVDGGEWVLLPRDPVAALPCLHALADAAGIERLSDPHDDGSYPITGQQSTVRQWYEKTLDAAPPAQTVDLPYSLDADPAGIRARVADVITGTLMVGAQGHTPPPAGHWAEPFWQMARADAAAQGIDLGQLHDSDVRAWVERNDLGGSFGSFTDARAAFDDARTAHLIDGQAVLS